MKRRILLTFLVMVLLLTGCGKVTTNSNTNNNDKTEIKVGEVAIKLNTTTSLGDMSFKVPIDITSSHLGTYYIGDYMNNGEFVFRVAIYDFENKTIDQAMEGSSIVYRETKEINGRAWKVYEGKTQDNKIMINYAYRNNSDTYTVTFISDSNMDNLINSFMNEVSFK